MTIDALEIPLCRRPVVGSIRPPGSKSITNRALVCAALARGTSTLFGALDSQDTRVMVDGLRALGIGVEPDWPAGRIVVHGSGGRIPATAATLDCAASGTTIRFLAAVCGLGQGTYRLDGTARMRKRPIGDLLDALRALGVEASAESPGGCPPVVIRSPGMPGGATTVRGATSSQFASALAMVAPCTPAGMTIDFEGRLVSLPYLEMTRRVMADFGAACRVDTPTRWSIPAGPYLGKTYAIEPDASAASYFLAAAAITGGSVTVEGLSRRSMQGDVAFAAALERMGCALEWHESGDDPADDAVTVSGRATRGIDIDMNAISDTVPTLGVVALFADGPTTIRHVAHIRDKETDRIGDLARELSRLGARIEERPDGLTIHPGALVPAELATYDDHRMAMSLALAGLVVPGVRILDPLCTGKTFPGYWQELAAIAALDTGAWPEGLRS
ncbi:MAG: 3-phosphoshikimate 1-carboxyvinyltransferase [Planctomycetota bacterium]|jgi:3-phosphoshikimate 1-carboxyvinyltransferase|nr:3-phosphoshikimate 1-carboxyvinyltransferase [Planctomycetota bacterium]